LLPDAAEDAALAEGKAASGLAVESTVEGVVAGPADAATVGDVEGNALAESEVSGLELAVVFGVVGARFDGSQPAKRPSKRTSIAATKDERRDMRGRVSGARVDSKRKWGFGASLSVRRW
jgi:hypothetical protein